MVWRLAPYSYKGLYEKKNKITNREVIKQLGIVSKITLSNQSSLTILSDFLYNYLDMKERQKSILNSWRIK